MSVLYTWLYSALFLFSFSFLNWKNSIYSKVFDVIEEKRRRKFFAEGNYLEDLVNQIVGFCRKKILPQIEVVFSKKNICRVWVITIVRAYDTIECVCVL